jgi:hypothetical protein
MKNVHRQPFAGACAYFLTILPYFEGMLRFYYTCLLSRWALTAEGLLVTVLPSAQRRDQTGPSSSPDDLPALRFYPPRRGRTITFRRCVPRKTSQVLGANWQSVLSRKSKRNPTGWKPAKI